MKISKKIKEWKKSQKELMKLKKEIEGDRENLKFIEKELIKNGWTWDFSGVLPELVKPNKSKLSKGKK